MNAIATRAREAASHLEVKKDSLRQTQDGLWKITLTAAELPAWLLAASMGTRMVCALVQIGDDEHPVSPAEPKPTRDTDAARERGKLAYATADEMTRACTRAALLCRDKAFQAWCRAADEHEAANYMRREIGALRREIGLDPTIYGNFVTVETNYREDTGQLPERRG